MRSRRDRRGFALVAVLLVLAILGVVGAEFAFSMRLEASAVRSWKDTVIGTHLAEAAIEQAIREIVPDYAFIGYENGTGPLTFYAQDRTVRPRLPRRNVPLASGQFSYTITDEEGRLNVNTSPPDRVDRLLLCRGLDKSARDVIVDSLQDWRDTDEEHRLNGAESDDTYLKLSVPYRAKNGNLDSVRELLQVKGITPALFNGTDNRPGLVEDLTVKTPGPININTAEPRVFCALGLSPAEISLIEQTRADSPYVAVPGQFGGRGLGVTSRTFRILAEGIVGGRIGSKLVAVVQKRQAQAGTGIVFLETSTIR